MKKNGLLYNMCRMVTEDDTYFFTGFYFIFFDILYKLSELICSTIEKYIYLNKCNNWKLIKKITCRFILYFFD